MNLNKKTIKNMITAVLFVILIASVGVFLYVFQTVNKTNKAVSSLEKVERIETVRDVCQSYPMVLEDKDNLLNRIISFKGTVNDSNDYIMAGGDFGNYFAPEFGIIIQTLNYDKALFVEQFNSYYPVLNTPVNEIIGLEQFEERYFCGLTNGSIAGYEELNEETKSNIKTSREIQNNQPYSESINAINQNERYTNDLNNLYKEYLYIVNEL